MLCGLRLLHVNDRKHGRGGGDSDIANVIKNGLVGPAAE